MAKYNVYLGGNKRVDATRANGESMWDAGLDPADQHVEYAAHLKTRHKTMQYYYDDGHEHTRMFYRSKGLGVLPVGDELGVILLAAGSMVNNIVFHNKKAADGKVKVILNGKAGDAPADISALLDAVAAAKEAQSAAIAEANTDPTNAALKKKVAAAKQAVADAEKALTDANNTEVQSFDVDLSKVGYTVLRADKFLQTNGDITVNIVEGSLSGSCWTVSASVESHNDQHGCSCYTAPCDTVYPDPLCVRIPS